MIIVLTGTPGTGKTTVSEELTSHGYEVVHLSKFLDRKDIGEKVNREREVDVDLMVEELEQQDFPEDFIIEGHLAHHFPADICVVLRCRPDILKERLSKREYSETKIEENIEAEKIDLVLAEAVEKQEKVVEIGTAGKKVEETAEEINKKIKEGESDYGNLDWTEFI